MNSDDNSSVETRLANLCKGLAITEDVSQEAISLLNESKNILLSSPFGSRPPEETERCFFSFVLYCASKLSKKHAKEERQDGRIWLYQILKGLNLTVEDFFKEAKQFSLKSNQILSNRYGSDWEDRLELKQLENIVKLLTDASKFYEKAYRDLFTVKPSGENSDKPKIFKEIHKFGWLIFLALRTDSPELFKDLVSCVHGLVSVLAMLILHASMRFQNFSVQDSLQFSKRSDKGMDLIGSLCHTHHTSEDSLRSMIEKTYKIFSEILKEKPIPASDCKTELLDQINTDGLMYFEDLLNEESLNSKIQILEEYCGKGEIDERLFANDDSSFLSKINTSVGDSNSSSIMSKFETLASPKRTIASMLALPQSPLSPSANPNNSIIKNPKITQMTPITSAMTTAKWLREVISPLPDKPSPQLQQFLSSANQDLTPVLTSRAHIILEAIFNSSNSFDTFWARERKSEASKLYYRVLQSICTAESQLANNNSNNNNSSNNLTQLLSNERFHRCMLACSAELVLATHKTVIMMFPAVLESTGLTGFDLSKVIESFVRHEETLPRELKRHLNSLEEQLLESTVWAKGSSLYNSLVIARPDLGSEINRFSLLAEPMPSLDDIAIHHNISVSGPANSDTRKRDASPDENESDARSPKRARTELGTVSGEKINCFTPPAKERLLAFCSLKSKLPPLQSTFASPAQPSPAGGSETCAEIGCKVFFSKILKLGAIRIRSLCERLRQTQQLLERVYGIFQKVLEKHTPLFFNRHVDQIILCCFYGVAKVSRINLTFKEIVSGYKKEPQSKPEVFRSVFVGSSSANTITRTGVNHVDIITFYNDVFVPAVKPLLVGFVPRPDDKNNSTDGQNIPESPKISPFSNLPDMSPKKVSNSHNVYVSPLRQSKKDALLSPSSRSYYACIGESTHAFQSPSKDLDAINTRLNCSGRRISGRINFDVVSDSVVAGSLGYQNGSSASSDLPVKREQPET